MKNTIKEREIPERFMLNKRGREPLGRTLGPSRKGQFFIVSAVIIASVLLIISHSFLGFSNISLTRNAEMSELEHIGMIKKKLNDTAAASACDRLEEDISAAEGFLSRKLAEQGIEMSVKHEIISCENVRFSFNLTSQNFFSSTQFKYP